MVGMELMELGIGLMMWDFDGFLGYWGKKSVYS